MYGFKPHKEWDEWRQDRNFVARHITEPRYICDHIFRKIDELTEYLTSTDFVDEDEPTGERLRKINALQRLERALDRWYAIENFQVVLKIRK